MSLFTPILSVIPHVDGVGNENTERSSNALPDGIFYNYTRLATHDHTLGEPPAVHHRQVSAGYLRRAKVHRVHGGRRQGRAVGGAGRGQHSRSQEQGDCGRRGHHGPRECFGRGTVVHRALRWGSFGPLSAIQLRRCTSFSRNSCRIVDRLLFSMGYATLCCTEHVRCISPCTYAEEALWLVLWGVGVRSGSSTLADASPPYVCMFVSEVKLLSRTFHEGLYCYDSPSAIFRKD